MGLWNWLDERAGTRALGPLLRHELDRPVPGHVNWLHTLGAAALALFLLQGATGVLLSFNYTPSMEQAHESVRKITHQIPFGWLIRSVHHWTAQILVIVLVAHLMTAVGYAAYRKPRELTWISGVALLLLTLGLCLTGYLLPMEQLSYWATTVVTDLSGGLPLIGDGLADLARGGPSISDATLSRFTILHILVLPALVVAILGAHLYLVHRLGLATRSEAKPPTTFGRVLHRDVAAAFLVIGAVAALAVLWPRAVDPPFDPLRTESGTRPEWYFLPVYQLLKYLPKLAGLATLFLATLALAAYPWIDPQGRRRWLAVAGLSAAFVLGVLGYVSDRSFEVLSWTISFDSWGWPR
jgi:quinol-cytochrome oxidoreductase complex cytochrome b subunit